MPLNFKRNDFLFLAVMIGLIALCTVLARHGLLLRNRCRSANDFIVRSPTLSAAKTGPISCSVVRNMPPGTFPPIALASFPGSGNTWTRHLIETSSGYATSTVYNTRLGLHTKKDGDDPMSGRALTVKTHEFDVNMTGAVLLVRNPYRAMISEYNRLNAGSKTRHAPKELFATPEWRSFVTRKTRNWFNLYDRYISRCRHPGNTCKSVLLVYYEQLQEQLVVELRRILEYLSVSIDEERLACVIRNSEGSFHRPKKNRTLEPYTIEDRRLIDASLKSFRDLVKREGLEKPPPSFMLYPSDL